MTTAIIGTGGLGSVIARHLASGGETLRLSSADAKSARMLAAQIGPAAVVAAGNRDALQGAGAVILAVRFTVLKSVMDEIADPLTGKLVVVPSNPVSADAQGNISRLLPEGQSSAGDNMYQYENVEGLAGDGVMAPIAMSTGSPTTWLHAIDSVVASLDGNARRILPFHEGNVWKQFPSVEFDDGLHLAEVSLAGGHPSLTHG